MRQEIVAAADEWKRRNPELIAVLAASAPQLRSLEHWYPKRSLWDPIALPADLGRLSQLTRLILGFSNSVLSPAQVDAVVQGLPSLRHLALSSHMMRDFGFPFSITRCSQLSSLRIIGCFMIEAVPPELGRLTALKELQLSGEVSSLPDSISQLSALQDLNVSRNRDLTLPPGLAACRQLTWLDIMSCNSAFPVLASLHSLRHLAVSYVIDQQPQETYWTQLTGLTGLVLDWSTSWERSAVPAGLGGMAGLRRLGIVGAAIDDLPAGPLLSRLEELRLRDCDFPSGVPAALASATRLHTLEVAPCKGIELIAGDIAVLISMPALKNLELVPTRKKRGVWKGRVAQLRALWHAQGVAPPAIRTR